MWIRQVSIVGQVSMFIIMFAIQRANQTLSAHKMPSADFLTLMLMLIFVIEMEISREGFTILLTNVSISI